MVTCPSSRLRLAIAPGVPSSQLSALLAQHREEEPDIAITLLEVKAGDALPGVRSGRYDAAISSLSASDSDIEAQPPKSNEADVIP